MCFPQQICIRNITVDSEPSVSRRFRKRQERSYPKGRDKVILDRNYFILHFLSDKLSYYKTYDFRKILIPDAFKHVGLQNTFNRCKVHRILSLMNNYAGFLVKSKNYQNIMCTKKIYFFARSCQSRDRAQFLERILQ